MPYNHARMVSKKQLLLGISRPGRWVWTLDWCSHLCSCFLIAPYFQAVEPAPLALPKPHLPWALQLAGPAPESVTTNLLLNCEHVTIFRRPGAHRLEELLDQSHWFVTIIHVHTYLLTSECLQSDCSAVIVCVHSVCQSARHARNT